MTNDEELEEALGRIVTAVVGVRAKVDVVDALRKRIKELEDRISKLEEK